MRIPVVAVSPGGRRAPPTDSRPGLPGGRTPIQASIQGDLPVDAEEAGTRETSRPPPIEARGDGVFPPSALPACIAGDPPRRPPPIGVSMETASCATAEPATRPAPCGMRTGQTTAHWSNRVGALSRCRDAEGERELVGRGEPGGEQAREAGDDDSNPSKHRLPRMIGQHILTPYPHI